uniref:Uncharacterized protein n=1 Tax=Ditylum brightwellii TaxID=49249 RepID=A0A6V2HR37_9STRA|mmetsp:Transcript_30871/g.41197  ORF Transcript_30871/g.41197 Transcript_30871/m.41197 type:complete len:628 (+) Transcript_30871:387-2270(+)
MRVWKVWYDDARNHLRHNMERDTPGEEHDRQLFKYVVDVEKEEDEQHRLALQQHIHYNENMKKVEHQQQQEQQAEEQEAEEHQKSVFAVGAQCRASNIVDQSSSIPLRKPPNNKRDLCMTPAAIRARKRRKTKKNVTGEKYFRKNLKQKRLDRQQQELREEEDDEEDGDKKEVEKESKEDNGSNKNILGAVATNSQIERQHGTDPNKGEATATAGTASISSFPSALLSQQQQKMFEDLFDAYNAADAGMVKKSNIDSSFSLKRSSLSPFSPSKGVNSIGQLRGRKTSNEINNEKGDDEGDIYPPFISLGKRDDTDWKKQEVVQVSSIVTESTDATCKGDYAQGLPKPIRILDNSHSSQEQNGHGQQEQHQQQCPQAGNKNAKADPATNGATSIMHSSFSIINNVPTGVEIGTNTLKKNTTKQKGSSESAEKEMERMIESSSTSSFQNNEGYQIKASTPRSSASVIKIAVPEKKQTGVNIIKCNDDWNTVYSKLMIMGWSVVSGKGLSAFFYVHPSFAGRKKADIMKEGVPGRDYMDNENELKMYCRIHYGWLGELLGGTNSNYWLNPIQNSGTGYLGNSGSSSVGESTKNQGGKEMSSEGGTNTEDMSSFRKRRRSRSKIADSLPPE